MSNVTRRFTTLLGDEVVSVIVVGEAEDAVDTVADLVRDTIATAADEEFAGYKYKARMQQHMGW